MNVRTKILMCAAMVAAVAISCTKIDYTPLKIELKPVIGSETRKANENGFSRIFPVNETFTMWGYDESNGRFIEAEKMASVSGKWASATLWPIDKGLRFEAISQGEGSYAIEQSADNTLSIKGFKSPESGIDLLYAPLTPVCKREDNIPVPLDFTHVLSKVDFRVINGMPEGVSLRVFRITMKGLSLIGDFTASKGNVSWQPSSGMSNFDFYNVPGSEHLYGDAPEFIGSHYLFVPQSGRVDIEIEYAFSVDGEIWLDGQIDTIKDYPISWAPGGYTTYTLSVNIENMKVTSGINNWNNR